MKTNSINKVLFSLALFLTVGLTTVAQDDVVFIEESDFSEIDFSSGGSNLQQMFSDLSAATFAATSSTCRSAAGTFDNT